MKSSNEAPVKLEVSLAKKSRDELNVLAKHLRIHGYRKLKRDELIAALLVKNPSKLTRQMFPTWWTRHHNHVYFLVSVILAVTFFLIQEFGGSRVKTTSGRNEFTSTVPISSEVPSRKHNPNQQPTLAVLYFENNSTDEKYAPLAKAMCAMMITYINETKVYNIVERQRLQDVLEELELSNTRQFDRASAARIGKLLGAHQLVLGSYLVLGRQLRIDARIIDVETGELLSSVGSEGSPDQFGPVLKKVAYSLAQEGDKENAAPTLEYFAGDELPSTVVAALGNAYEEYDNGNYEIAIAAVHLLNTKHPDSKLIKNLLAKWQKAHL